MKKILTTLMFLGLILSGCTMEIEPVIPDQETGTETGSEGTIRFNICMDAQTKSSIAIDENQLSNVNIYAYCDGKLYANAYSTTPKTVSLKLKKGCSYNLYAVANTSAMEPVVNEEEFVRTFKVSIADISEMNNKNLLAWSYTGYTLSSNTANLDMRMTRLYSRVNFMLDKGVLKGLEVKSVRLHQAAGAVYPFTAGGSKVSSAAEVIDGDYASAEDLNTLNTTGYGIHFYALENMQGNILPSNTDPWKKTPESISGRDQLCTYIEVQATFKSGFFYTGNVTYRFYLGQDSTKNFDIIRNTDMTVTLTLTGDHFGSSDKPYSWKIDNGIDINPTTRSASATMKYIKSSKGEKVIYFGQNFEMNLYLEEEVFNHLDRNIDNCYIGASNQDGFNTSSLMALTPFNEVALSKDNNHFQIWGTVKGIGQCKFALYDKRTNQKIQDIYLQGAAQETQAELECMKMPLTLSNSSRYNNKDIIKTFMINGQEERIWVFPGDEQNLNVTDYFTMGSATAPAIDVNTISKSCPNLEGYLETYLPMTTDINDYISYNVIWDKNPSNGMPISTLKVKLENKKVGAQYTEQMVQALGLGDKSAFTLTTLSDSPCYFVKKSFKMDYYPLDINVFWDMNGAGTVYELTNPSNIPLDLDFDFFCRTTLHRNSSTETAHKYIVSVPTTDQQGKYITHDFWGEMDHWRRNIHLDNNDYSQNKQYYTVPGMYHKESSSYYSLDYFYYLDLKIGDGKGMKAQISNEKIKYYAVPKHYVNNSPGNDGFKYPTCFIYSGGDINNSATTFRGEYTNGASANPSLSTTLQNSTVDLFYNDVSKVMLSEWTSLFATTPRTVNYRIRKVVTDPNFTPDPSHTYRDYDPHEFELYVGETFSFLEHNCEFDVGVDFHGEYKECKVANPSTYVPVRSFEYEGNKEHHAVYGGNIHYIGHKNAYNSIETIFYHEHMNNLWVDLRKEWHHGWIQTAKNTHWVTPHPVKLSVRFGGLSIKGNHEIHAMPINFDLGNVYFKWDHYEIQKHPEGPDESYNNYNVHMETTQLPWNIFTVHDMQ